MPARTKSGFGWTALFWSFALGVTAALAVAAAVFMFINNAPVPFVNKVDQSAVAVDEELLDGRLDPNKKLYAEGQGEVQQAAQPGAVAAVTADGKSATALPGSAAAQGTSEGETLDTHRYWVQAGAFSQSADAESMRARIAFIGLDAQISYRNEGGQRLYRVRVGPFDTEAQAEEIRQSLADNAIQGNLIKLQD